MRIVTDYYEFDLAYPLAPDVVAALAAVIRDEREQEDEEWAAFLARQEPCEMENVKCKMENERTPVGRDDPIAPPTLKSESAWRTAKRERVRERERMRARLAERDAAYEREFGSAAQTGAVRGRVAGGSFRGFPLVSSMSYYG